MPPSKNISFDELSKYFHLPINQVAKELGVCATILKKICRKNQIPRWPHRKIKSLDKMIANLEMNLTKNPHEKEEILREIESLQEKKKEILNNPDILANKGQAFDDYLKPHPIKMKSKGKLNRKEIILTDKDEPINCFAPVGNFNQSKKNASNNNNNFFFHNTAGFNAQAPMNTLPNNPSGSSYVESILNGNNSMNTPLSFQKSPQQQQPQQQQSPSINVMRSASGADLAYYSYESPLSINNLSANTNTNLNMNTFNPNNVNIFAGNQGFNMGMNMGFALPSIMRVNQNQFQFDNFQVPPPSGVTPFLATANKNINRPIFKEFKEEYSPIPRFDSFGQVQFPTTSPSNTPVMVNVNLSTQQQQIQQLQQELSQAQQQQNQLPMTTQVQTQQAPSSPNTTLNVNVNSMGSQNNLPSWFDEEKSRYLQKPI